MCREETWGCFLVLSDVRRDLTESAQLTGGSGGGRARKGCHPNSAQRQSGEGTSTRWPREQRRTLWGHIMPWVSHAAKVSKNGRWGLCRAVAEEPWSNGRTSKPASHVGGEGTSSLQSSGLKISYCLLGRMICCRLSRYLQRVNVDQIIPCGYWPPCFLSCWVSSAIVLFIYLA